MENVAPINILQVYPEEIIEQALTLAAKALLIGADATKLAKGELGKAVQVAIEFLKDIPEALVILLARS